jgi:hypothetical protein
VPTGGGGGTGGRGTDRGGRTDHGTGLKESATADAGVVFCLTHDAPIQTVVMLQNSRMPCADSSLP